MQELKFIDIVLGIVGLMFIIVKAFIIFTLFFIPIEIFDMIWPNFQIDITVWGSVIVIISFIIAVKISTITILKSIKNFFKKIAFYFLRKFIDKKSEELQKHKTIQEYFEKYGASALEEKNLNTFIAYLREKENIKVKPSILREILLEIDFEQRYQRFQDHFYLTFPSLTPDNRPKEKQLIEAYASLYNDNRQLEYFLELLARNRNKSFSRRNVEKLIESEKESKSLQNDINTMQTYLNTNELHYGVISIDDIDIIDGHKFEHFLKILFEYQGYKVEQTKLSSDQGLDLILYDTNDNKIGVQAKRFSNSVGNSAVQEAISGREFYQCSEAMVVTNSNFTPSAKALALKTNIKLIDRDLLIHWIQDFNNAWSLENQDRNVI